MVPAQMKDGGEGRVETPGCADFGGRQGRRTSAHPTDHQE